jgi:hypothetical protein
MKKLMYFIQTALPGTIRDSEQTTGVADLNKTLLYHFVAGPGNVESLGDT